jgi:hypothetical protein
MGFDRTKAKATSVAALQAQERDHETKRPSNRNNFDRNYHTVKEGDNWYRIFPAHPKELDGGDSFAEPKCVTFLNVAVPKRDDDKKVIEGEFEVKLKPLFNSKVHGNVGKDIVEEYMTVAKTVAIPEFTGDDTETADKIWGLITGYRDSKGNFHPGVKPQDTWVAYAVPITGFTDTGEAILGSDIGLLEIKKSVKTKMNERAIEFAADDINSPDPFSDPDDGICVNITKKGSGKDAYGKELHTVKEGKFDRRLIPTPLSDELLEKWSQMDSLKKLFVNSFKRSDLEKQLDGLKRFDDELSKKGFAIRVLERPEFLEVAEELLTLVPEDEQQEEKEEKKEQPKVEKPKPIKPTLNKPVKPTLPKKQVVVEEVEEEAEEIEVTEEAAPVSNGVDVNSRLNSLMAKLGKKK